MAADSRDDDELVDVRLQMQERQVQLLEELSADGGPFEHPNEALQYIIGEYEGLSVREPVKVK